MPKALVKKESHKVRTHFLLGGQPSKERQQQHRQQRNRSTKQARSVFLCVWLVHETVSQSVFIQSIFIWLASIKILLFFFPSLPFLLLLLHRADGWTDARVASQLACMRLEIVWLKMMGAADRLQGKKLKYETRTPTSQLSTDCQLKNYWVSDRAKMGTL